MSLSASTVLTLHRKAIEKYGGLDGVRDFAPIDNLEAYVQDACIRYDWDEIECICLAAYQIAKSHPFVDGNKRTATLVLLNCLRKAGYSYTGKEKDLMDRTIWLSKTLANKKEESILDFSYFMKSKIQTR